MHLTESEQKSLVFENKIVHQEGHGERRWSEYMSTTVKADDGKFYRVNWDRALTENGENEFESGEVPEVFPVNSMQVYSETLYLTVEEQAEIRPTLAEKVMGEGEAYSIAVGQPIYAPVTEELYNKALSLRGSLDELAALDFVADSGAYREATKQYLNTIIRLWEEKVSYNA